MTAWAWFCATMVPAQILAAMGHAHDGHTGGAGLSAALTGLYAYWLAQALQKKAKP